MAIPREIAGKKYISLVTYRKNGAGVHTPVWFGEEDGKLYVTCRGDSGKCKRIRNSSKAAVAPCTIRGKITGPEFAATARIVPLEERERARDAIRRKYWMARISFVWGKSDTCLEIDVTG